MTTETVFELTALPATPDYSGSSEIEMRSALPIMSCIAIQLIIANLGIPFDTMSVHSDGRFGLSITCSTREAIVQLAQALGGTMREQLTPYDANTPQGVVSWLDGMLYDVRFYAEARYGIVAAR